MDEIIAYCGGTCHMCAIFLATRENDDEKKHETRVEIAQQIKELYGKEIEADDIADCDRCRAEDGSKFSKDCQIRKCAQEKDLESCASCTEYPFEKLEKSFTYLSFQTINYFQKGNFLNQYNQNNMTHVKISIKKDLA